MRTNLLYAYCPECGYQNIYHTDRRFRRVIRAESWPGLAWQCESCGREFESEVQWITTSFEKWCAFWLYYRHFNWKILGVAFLACVFFAAGGIYFSSYLPEWLQTLTMVAIFMAAGAGFLLPGEIPHAYPVYVVDDRRRASRQTSRRRR